MDKAKARKMYELATRLSSVNANELSEQQLSERNSMITRLQEEMTKMREGHTVPTATGVRHQASPGVYGGSDRDEDPDTELDKNFVNRAEKAIGIKWGRENKRAPGINLDDSLNGMAEGADDKFSVADKVEELVDQYRLYDERGWTDLFSKLAGKKLYGPEYKAEIYRAMGYASKFLQLLDSIRMRSDYRGQQDPREDQELIDLSNQWLSLFNMAVIEFKAMRGQGVAENTAAGINKMFNNLGDPVYANLQRVALLAMQGRQSEAAGRLQSVIKDASTDIQKKITDAVNNIKPVTINGKIADSSTLDKSKQHNDWIINTFIPWVQSLLGKQGVAEAAKWRDPKYQGKTFDYDDSYEGPHDNNTSIVSLDRAGMRQFYTDTFDPLEYKAREKQATGKLTPQNVKYATAKNFGKEKQQQLDYDRSRKAEQGVAEDGHEDMNGAPASGAVHYNVGKLSKEIGTDPRQLKIAIQRSITGNPTRQDTLTVANAFISILKTGDDQTIQNIANIIKAGNPRKDSAQESVAPKVTKAEEVKEEINTEAYNRLRKVFDFSNFKG